MFYEVKEPKLCNETAGKICLKPFYEYDIKGIDKSSD